MKRGASNVRKESETADAGSVAETTIEVIHDAIDELNRMRAPGDDVNKDLSTVIVGAGSLLDSLDLINLVLSIEDGLNCRGFRAEGLGEKVFGSGDIKTLSDLKDLVVLNVEPTDGRLKK